MITDDKKLVLLCALQHVLVLMMLCGWCYAAAAASGWLVLLSSLCSVVSAAGGTVTYSRSFPSFHCLSHLISHPLP